MNLLSWLGFKPAFDPMAEFLQNSDKRVQEHNDRIRKLLDEPIPITNSGERVIYDSTCMAHRGSPVISEELK